MSVWISDEKLLIFASLISPSKMILFEKKYQTFDTVFHHQMKHLEVRQKYSAARRIFNSLLGVSSGDETLHLMFDILLTKRESQIFKGIQQFLLYMSGENKFDHLFLFSRSSFLCSICVRSPSFSSDSSPPYLAFRWFLSSSKLFSSSNWFSSSVPDLSFK